MHGRLDHMGEVQAVPAKDRGQIRHGLRGLLFNGGAHRFARGRVVRRLAGGVEEPVGGDGLGVRARRAGSEVCADLLS